MLDKEPDNLITGLRTRKKILHERYLECAKGNSILYDVTAYICVLILLS